MGQILGELSQILRVQEDGHAIYLEDSIPRSTPSSGPYVVPTPPWIFPET